MYWRHPAVRFLSIFLAAVMIGFPLSNMLVTVYPSELAVSIQDLVYVLAVFCVLISTVFSFTVVAVLLDAAGYAVRIQLLGGFVPLSLVMLFLLNLVQAIPFLVVMGIILAFVGLPKTTNAEEDKLKKRLLIHVLSVILFSFLFLANALVSNLLHVDSYETFQGLVFALVDASMLQVLIQIPLVNHKPHLVTNGELLYMKP